jgi:MFS family permease
MNSPHVNRLLVAKGLRAFGDGYVSLLLPVYLLELGYSALQVGIIATATLLGSGLLTLAVGLRAYRFHYRAVLLAATALMAATGFGFAAITSFWPLLVIAFVGTLNPSSGDVSVFLPLEHAVLSRLVGDRQRTAVFARYSLVGALAAAVGALAAAAPTMIGEVTGLSTRASIQAMFVVYALLGVLAAIAYRGLPTTAESGGPRANVPLGEAKKRIWTLAALFSLDAFGGGFVVQSMVALWLYQRFELSFAAAGAIFFWTGILTAASYLVAVKIAGRFGLVNTMVFTHVPSSVLLVTAACAGSFPVAATLFLLREGLVEMDVPTRQSYVLALVRPEERTAASGITNIVRLAGWAVGPPIAGLLSQSVSLAAPLFVGAGMKLAYDALLYVGFRHTRPPEES